MSYEVINECEGCQITFEVTAIKKGYFMSTKQLLKHHYNGHKVQE